MLSLTPEINFWSQCPDNLVDLLPDLNKSKSNYIENHQINMKDSIEIFSRFDIAYCSHWAAREGLLQEFKNSGDIEKSIYYRRKPFEWVFSDDGWDELNLDT